MTPEAEAELALQGIPAGGTDSGIDAPVYDPDNPAAQAFFSDSTASGENIYGDVFGGDSSVHGPPPREAEPSLQPNMEPPVFGGQPIASVSTVPQDKPLVDPERPRRDDVKTTPPKADEWLDFFSRIVLKVGMELYTDFAFRGIDENIVKEEDLRRIAVRKDERDTIAQPFAEFTSKTKFNTKNGRKVIALSSSAESLMTLGIWARRVNRIARKYRPKETKPQRPQVRLREAQNGDNGSPTGDGYVQGTANGRIPDGFGVYNPGSG